MMVEIFLWGCFTGLMLKFISNHIDRNSPPHHTIGSIFNREWIWSKVYYSGEVFDDSPKIHAPCVSHSITDEMKEPLPMTEWAQ